MRLKAAVATLALACALTAAGCTTEPEAPAPADPASLEDVEFFAYQIQEQHLDSAIDEIVESDYDLIIIDQTRSIVGEEDYDSAADVAAIQTSPGTNVGRKIVVCYVDVGEAESYRVYWEDDWEVGDPEWIVAPDPDGWDENYPVAYWDDEWRDIMYGVFDSIVEDGYDGAYLDWLEAYEFEPVIDAAEEAGLDSEEELISFVEDLADSARSQKPGFLMIAQNAAIMGEHADYVEVFDAIAQEAIWYDGVGDPDEPEQTGDTAIEPELTQEYLDALALWLEADRPVFAVEYAIEPGHVERAYELGGEHGFITYVTTRPLAMLTETPPPGY